MVFWQRVYGFRGISWIWAWEMVCDFGLAGRGGLISCDTVFGRFRVCDASARMKLWVWVVSSTVGFDKVRSISWWENNSNLSSNLGLAMIDIETFVIK